jgi:ribosomal protein S18 acetylase RimI-like enzyme
MDFSIRAARAEDARAIAQVQVESWKTTYGEIVPKAFLDSLDTEVRAQVWLEQLSKGTNILFVAENRSGIFGFASGGALREAIDGYDGELFAIYLLRAFQRGGAGRRLIQTLAHAMDSDGFQRMAVWVLAQNPAVSFYKRIGGVQLAAKTIDIGGEQRDELAFGFELSDLCSRPDE